MGAPVQTSINLGKRCTCKCVICAFDAGLMFDRHWMIVSDKHNAFITQRSHPRMSQVSTALPAEALALRHLHDIDTLAEQPPPCLALSFGQFPDLQVPLRVDDYADLRQNDGLTELAADALGEQEQRKLVEARVWEWQGAVLDEGAHAAEWLSEALQERVRLVPRSSVASASLCTCACAPLQRFAGPPSFTRDSTRRLVRHVGDLHHASEAAPRPSDGRRAVDRTFAEGAETAFADGYPLTLVSEVRAGEIQA